MAHGPVRFATGKRPNPPGVVEPGTRSIAASRCRGLTLRLSLPVNPSAERDGARDGAGCPQGDETRGGDLL